jgi:cytochrome c oxidase subunit 2
MAAFSQLNDAEIAAVITYQRNSFGNAAGDLVQPSTIKNEYR